MKEETSADNLSTTEPNEIQSPTPEMTMSAASKGWATLLLALLALGIAGFAVWQSGTERTRIDELRVQLAERFDTGETTAKKLQSGVRQQEETVAALQRKLYALETKVEAREGQAVALDALYQEFSRSREDRLLAEVEQAIVMAEQQLQLAGNLGAALVALQSAEARLVSGDHGQFAILHKALENDIEKLKRIPSVDIPETAQRLEKVQEGVDALPLIFERELSFVERPAHSLPEHKPSSGEEGSSQDHWTEIRYFLTGIGHDLWNELRSLVRVERIDHQSDFMLLSPSQSAFLRENLKIRLLTARLALLARDGRTYSTDLEQAQQWIERFCDVNNPQVQTMLSDLKKLQMLPVSAELPTLTDSLAALRVLQTRSVPSDATTSLSAPSQARRASSANGMTAQP